MPSAQSITGSSFDDPAAKKRHATDGRPLPGVEIRLLDAGGRPVPASEPGEICACPDLFVGYTDPALTHALLTTTAGIAP